MKNFLLADNRSELMATLGPILKHWGYRVLSTTKVEDITSFIQESSPSLLIIGKKFLADPKLELDATTTKKINSGDLPLIALEQETVAPTPLLKPLATLTPPLEIFDLFAFIQRHVEKHPRQNLRLRVILPGMYCVEKDQFALAEVLSLSMNGLFFKVATKLKVGDKVTVVIPLMGHAKEVEVEATVVYTVQPAMENNYMQGFGVRFDDLSEIHQESLQHFIKDRFLREVSANQDGVGSLDKAHLSL
ncbi:MAG: PilZ domain-containing protein [Desulfuromonadales bacterium]|nr:PilZ domain-containing protein [Desulfuromonadales bacterium]